MLKRIKMKCWKCSETFELSLEITGSPRYQRQCPYCSANCIIDLNPYRSTTVEIQKGGKGVDSGTEQLNIPDIVPTSKPD